MSLQAKFKFGRYVIAINGKSEKDLWAAVSFWDELPCECGACQSKNLGMKHRVAKDYDFYEIECKDCGYFFALGQKQQGGGLYPRGNKDTGEWEPPYDPNGQDDGQRQSGPRQNTGQQQRSQQQPRQQQERQGGQPWRGNQGQDRPQQGRQQQRPQQDNSGPIQDALDDDDIPF